MNSVENTFLVIMMSNQAAFIFVQGQDYIPFGKSSYDEKVKGLHQGDLMLRKHTYSIRRIKQ